SVLLVSLVELARVQFNFWAGWGDWSACSKKLRHWADETNSGNASPPLGTFVLSTDAHRLLKDVDPLHGDKALRLLEHLV
uniref:FATC domain-containing protein n=1 Tax=Macrostomum lignano TaxID=282301 RepID=A0A1I8FC15_9PLAT